MMKIGIGCDELAFELKEFVSNELKEQGFDLLDYGCYDTNPINYPDIAAKVAEGIQKGEIDRGILVCGTGIGMAITANKHKGVYAAVCHDFFSTDRSIYANKLNVMCMGALVIGKMTALKMAEQWLSYTYVKREPMNTKLGVLYKIEEQNMK